MYKDREKEPGIKSGENYDIWRTPVLDQDSFNNLPGGERLRYLAIFGVMAATTHNTQPVAFKLDPENNNITVFLDKDRVLPASDVAGRQASISLGWSLANIGMAAKHFGLEPEILIPDINSVDVKPNTEPDQERYVQIAEINLKDTGVSTLDRKFVEAMISRRVNRKTYDTTRAIPSEVIEQIKKIEGDEISLHLIMRGDTRIQMFAELQSQADNFVANDAKFGGELSDWLLPNDTDSKFGMPGDTFNLGEETTIGIRQGLNDSSKMNPMDLGGFAIASKKGIESAAIVAMVTSKDDTPKNWVLSGIKLGKVADVLEQNGISIAIHAGLAEVKVVRRTVAILLAHTTEKPFLLFRAGYPNQESEIPPHSPRAGIDSLIIR